MCAAAIYLSIFVFRATLYWMVSFLFDNVYAYEYDGNKRNSSDNTVFCSHPPLVYFLDLILAPAKGYNIEGPLTKPLS